MNVIGVIPARMASTRFPGKPLAEIRGIPMIGHVYYRSVLCQRLDKIYIATCDEEICAYAASIGAPCIMTAETHERASDRTAEALQKIEAVEGERVDVVVMIQGDEPMLQPDMLDVAVTRLLDDPNLGIMTLMAEIKTDEEFESPNTVKMVVAQNGDALYLSREPIPSRKKTTAPVPMLKQLGLISFRRDYLLHFYSLDPTPLEIIESVDVMRVLEHGDRLGTALVADLSIGVDTPGDLERVNALMVNDSLMASYPYTSQVT